MRRHSTIIPVFLFLILAFTLRLNAGDKSNLQWYSFEKGLAEAKKTNKKMLVDVYTDWCGWCKRMDAETYSNAGIASYLQEKYVVVKLNAESKSKQSYNGRQYTEQELAGEFGVSGYPTTLFFKSDGTAITAVPGYANAADFKTILSYIAEDHYLNTKFEDYTKSKK
jgi:thioredoxin-related protein